jgi:hypothetical protein
MARSCNCENTCSCIVRGNAPIQVTGTGTPADPYIIDVSATTSILTADTETVTLSITGDGSPDDPYVLEATSTATLQSLTDVTDDAPQVGDTPTWNGTQFIYAAPSVAPGQVTSGDGLLGDGSAGNALRVFASGEWGTAPLTGDGQDAGLLTYLDTSGALRAQMPDNVPWENLANVPADRTRKITVSDAAPTGIPADGDVWLEF